MANAGDAANFDLGLEDLNVLKMEEYSPNKPEETKPNRFASVSRIELNTLIEDRMSNNTKRATAVAVKTFRAYLSEKSVDSNFETYSVQQLDDTLGQFYAEARNAKGEVYKKSTMSATRHGLNRFLQSCPNTANIDLIHDTEFRRSNEVFKAISVHLKKIGKGSIDHHSEMPQEDLQNLYKYFREVIDTPLGLLHKVFFDILFHICRRGRENLRELDKTHFGKSTDASGLLFYYTVKDEQTKNHQNDENMAQGRMYEVADNPLCPVKSLDLYLSKLHPECSALFQRPKKSPDPSTDVWYDNSPVGKEKLGSMMKTMSEAANLSQIYTNHCIRASCITTLDDGNFASRHIMTVSGHASENSIKSYSRTTKESIKRNMSHTLSSSVGLECVEEVDHKRTKTDTVAVCDSGDMSDIPWLSDSQEREFFEITDMPSHEVLGPCQNMNIEENTCIANKNMSVNPQINNSNVTINYFFT